MSESGLASGTGTTGNGRRYWAAPDLAKLAFRPGDQPRVWAVGPRIEHGHALAAHEQVDFHKAYISKQQTLPLSLIEFPPFRSGPLVGG